MDILNIISWVKGKRQVTSVDPTKSLIPVGLKDDRRDDGYLTGVISVEDLLAASASAIGSDGTSLYSTNPLAGPIGPIDNIVFGEQAGYNTPLVQLSNFIGNKAGYNATMGNLSNFLGGNAGRDATQAYSSNFLGFDAGRQAVNANGSNFLGNNTGSYAANTSYSNFLGAYSGYNASNANNSNFFGQTSGYQATNAYESVFIGTNTGQNATNANNSIFIGQRAGSSAIDAQQSIFLGYEAGMESVGQNVTAFGFRAHKGSILSGQTVFSNFTLPAYPNRAAALTNISVVAGAAQNCTYLYYNETTFAIEAVRL